MSRRVRASEQPSEAPVFSVGDWTTLYGQRRAMRGFWRMHLLSRAAHPQPCGEAWIADYGPLPCALPQGHDGPHRCYGSRGPIDFRLPADMQDG